MDRGLGAPDSIDEFGELIRFDPGESPVSHLFLNRCRFVPLYREADAQQLSESRPAHRSVRLGLSTILALHYKFYHNNDCNYGL